MPTLQGVTRICALSFLVTLGSVARQACAQDMAAAESLFREGRDLLDAGNVDAACPKLAESQRLDPSSGTLLNLAACHEKQGKTATAWAEYLAAARLAEAQRKMDRAAEAQRKGAELEPKLSYLTIRVTRIVPGVEIKRDDIALEASSIGSKIPVDPGRHLVAVTAPGYERVALDITLGAAADSQTLVIPELKKTAPESGAEHALSARSAAKPKPPQSVDPSVRSAGEKSGSPVEQKSANSLPWIIGGAGVAVAAVGGVFGAMALSAYSDAEDACPTHSGCGDDAMSLRNSAATRAKIANVGVTLGVVGIGVGAVMLLTSGSSSTTPGRQHGVLVPEVGPHGASVKLRGAF